MLTLIAVLLTAGTLLAGFGTVGFCLVATSAPTAADLAHARRLGTAGRWLTAAGVLLLWSSPLHVAGLAGLAVTAAACLAVATYLTKARIPAPAAA